MMERKISTPRGADIDVFVNYDDGYCRNSR
jgi:hypothetical protein